MHSFMIKALQIYMVCRLVVEIYFNTLILKNLIKKHQIVTINLMIWICRNYRQLDIINICLLFQYKDMCSFFRVFTSDFISSKMKHFHFAVWLISYNCLDDTIRNETHCECHFIAVILTEMKFISGDKISCKHYPKWNHVKGNICACFYFIKTKKTGFTEWAVFFGPSETKFHFISPAIKNNVNRIYFNVG